MSTVKIGNRLIGDDQPCFIVAEIGINHSGNIDLAKRLISVAVAAGCDAVKFQKRTVDVVYTPEELAKPRENPFGPTNGDLKYGLEFEQEEYEEIDAFCKSVKMPWFASPWDEGSVDFLEQFSLACLQDRLCLSHRRQPFEAHSQDRKADHSFDRNEHLRRDRSCG